MIARFCIRKCSEQAKGPCRSWQKCNYFSASNKRYVVIGETEKRDTSPLEADEQKDLFQMCSESNIEMVHIPNEAKRSAAVANELKKEGLRKGFPDNFFPYAVGKYHGLFIEMKRQDASASRVSPEQTEWINYLNQKGYCAKVCYGAAAAFDTVTRYLTGQPMEDKK